MKINDSRKPNKFYNFGELKDGDIFEDCDGIVWMKTEELTLDESHNQKVNAYTVEEGSPYYFHEEETVVPLNATLEITPNTQILHNFSEAFQWLQKGGTIRHARLWDRNSSACLNVDGNLVNEDGEIFDSLTTEEIFSNEWILIKW